LIKPHYQPFGLYSYRCYTRDDLKRVSQVKRFLLQGFTLQAAFKMVVKKKEVNGKG